MLGETVFSIIEWSHFKHNTNNFYTSKFVLPPDKSCLFIMQPQTGSCVLWITHKRNVQILHHYISSKLLKKICRGNNYAGIVGSVVECSPATRAARVRFPDDAILCLEFIVIAQQYKVFFISFFTQVSHEKKILLILQYFTVSRYSIYLQMDMILFLV